MSPRSSLRKTAGPYHGLPPPANRAPDVGSYVTSWIGQPSQSGPRSCQSRRSGLAVEDEGALGRADQEHHALCHRTLRPSSPEDTRPARSGARVARRTQQRRLAIPGFGPVARTSSTRPSASRSCAIQSPWWSPTSRTHHASASLRLRATPASTSVSSTLPLAQPEPGHDRHAQRGEGERLAADRDRPRHLAPEPVLRRPPRSASAARASPRGTPRPGIGRLPPSRPGSRPRRGRRGEVADDDDLFAVAAEGRRRGEPAGRDPPGEPALEFLISLLGHRGSPWCGVALRGLHHYTSRGGTQEGAFRRRLGHAGRAPSGEESSAVMDDHDPADFSRGETKAVPGRDIHADFSAADVIGRTVGRWVSRFRLTTAGPDCRHPAVVSPVEKLAGSPAAEAPRPGAASGRRSRSASGTRCGDAGSGARGAPRNVRYPTTPLR